MLAIVSGMINRSRTKEIGVQSLPQKPYAELAESLGIRLPEAEPLKRQLDTAWNSRLEADVKKRLLQKGVMTEEEFGWHLLELKRFFLLSAFMVNVPMYSKKVDAIWHEMLLFTKEYADFCEQFTGHMIHHQPSVHSGKNRTDHQHDRAVFEMMYSVVFQIDEAAEAIQGPFRRAAWREEFVGKLKNMPKEELAAFYQNEFFQNSNQYQELKQAIASKLCSLTEKAKQQPAPSRDMHYTYDPSLLVLSAAMGEDDDREKHHDSSSGAYSSCHSRDDYHRDSHHSHHDGHDSGSSDSGSSCSSCSSCSS